MENGKIQNIKKKYIDSKLIEVEYRDCKDETLYDKVL